MTVKELNIHQILQMIIVKVTGQDPVEESHDQKKVQIDTEVAANEKHQALIAHHQKVDRAALAVTHEEVNHEQIIRVDRLQFSIRKSQHPYKKNVSLLIDSVIQ